MISVPIYFNDLKPEKQKEFLEAVNAESTKEMNWDADIFPLAIVDFEEDVL